MGSPPRGTRSSGEDSFPAARTAASYVIYRWSALPRGSAVGLNVLARCREAFRSHVDGWISCELKLILRWFGYQYDYENFLSNVRGPPDKYGLLTLGRPSVRCYFTLRAWSPVCGSSLRVSHDNMTTKGYIYVSGTYTNFSVSFSVSWKYTDDCFSLLSGVLFPRE